MANQLGDGPIQKEYLSLMNALAKAIDEMFNERDVLPKKTGFVLLVFPLDGHEGRCNYISNGVNREDIVVLFKEQIKRFEGQPEMKGNA